MREDRIFLGGPQSPEAHLTVRCGGGAGALGIAVVGCGYVADLYMATLRHHPALYLTGAYDTNPSRLNAFCKHYRARPYENLETLLRDSEANIILNLTNPRSHYSVTHASLEAGKHVYTEKPLAMNSALAAELVTLAQRASLRLASAPCSLLGETCQTLWAALREGAIGKVRLVYANFDDGLTHRRNWSRWRSASGAPWPARDEFETGSSYEHAGYLLSWLAAFFGPARQVTAYSTCLFENKGVAVKEMAPDFSTGCVEYDDGVVARVTCSLAAPRDRSITVVGESGTLWVEDVRDDAAPVFKTGPSPNRIIKGMRSRLHSVKGRIETSFDLPWSIRGPRLQRRLSHSRRAQFKHTARGKPVDFMRGPSELAEAILEERPCRLSAELGLHITELIETLQYPERFDRPRILCTDFPSIEPLPRTR